MTPEQKCLEAITSPSTPELERLAANVQLRYLLEQWMTRDVERARECGATWEMVGDAAGMSKQAAQQRWG